MSENNWRPATLIDMRTEEHLARLVNELRSELAQARAEREPDWPALFRELAEVAPKRRGGI